MLKNNVEKASETLSISSVQRILFYGILFLIPWFVIPLPWDPTESVKTVAFIVLSSLVVLLEVIKWIWEGKITIMKSNLDIAVLALLGSFILSTVFALDKWTALWGFDSRLGLGLVGISFLLLFFFLSRNFINNTNQLIKAVEVFSLGILFLVLLSLLSFLRVDIFSWIPYINEFFVVGLPLTFSIKEIILISGFLLFLNIFLSINYIEEKKLQKLPIPFFTICFAFLSISIFSINQGIAIPIILLLFILGISIFLFMRLKKTSRFIPAMLSVLSILMIIFVVGFQNESFKDSVLGSSFEVFSPLQLGSDISWSITSTSIVDNFSKGLVGVGNDSFSFAYNAFKPATDAIIVLGNHTFTNASSELLTTLTNRGILGVVAWLFIGVVLLKIFISDITSEDSSHRKTQILVLELGVIFLFLGSIFLSYTFLTYFLFFVSLMLLIVLRSFNTNISEQFLVKFWAVNVGSVSQNLSKTINTINWSLTGLFILIAFAGFISLSFKVLSAAYVVRAEAYSLETIQRYEHAEEVTLDEREEYLSQMMSYYQKAREYNSSNPLLNRKMSLISVEIMNILVERYEKASDTERSSILSNIATWRNLAIDLTRESVNISPYTYANWNTRSNVFVSLISMGLSDYSEDALLGLQQSVMLNPLDFDSYYKAGQIYMIKEDYERALLAFNTVLSINGQHIPSLVLASRILIENNDTQSAISYLEAAKKILEINNQEDNDLYKSVLTSLNELGYDSTVQEDMDESEFEVSLDSIEDEFSPFEDN
jgi:tetratricopeptide (TPR) repeat protein